MAGFVNVPTDLQILEAVQSWVMTVTGLDINHVVQAHDNRVPEPLGGWAMVSHLSRKAIATPVSSYPSNTETVTQSFDYAFQLDCYGNGASDLAFVLQTLFRSDVTSGFFATFGQANGFAISPLYCDDATHNAFINGENQFEERWILRPHFNVAVSVATPQQFLMTPTINIHSILTKP